MPVAVTPLVTPEPSPPRMGIALSGTRRRRVGRLSLTRKSHPMPTVIMTANGPILSMLPTAVPGKPPKRPMRRRTRRGNGRGRT